MKCLEPTDIMYVNSWQETAPCKGKPKDFFPTAVSTDRLREIIQDLFNEHETRCVRPQGFACMGCKWVMELKERFGVLFSDKEEVQR